MSSKALAERRFSWFIGLCSLALLLLLNREIFFNTVQTVGDIANQNMPTRAFYQECLHRGDSFLWMPQLFCGFYVHGEGQGGLYHPEHWLLYRFLPLGPAITLELMLGYVFMYVGTFLMLRRFSFPVYASLFGAMSFAFSGFTLLHYGHMNGIEVVSHIPWMIYGIDVLLRSQDRRAVAAAGVGLALVKGSEFLMGYPFYTWCSFLIEFAYAAWVMRTQVGFRRVPFLLYALCSGILVGAIQIQPTRDMLLHSTRTVTDFFFRMSYSSHPMNLISLFSPFALHGQFFDTPFGAGNAEVSVYNGIFCTVCLFWLFIRYRPLVERYPILRAAWVCSVVALIFAFGYYGYVYRGICHLPVFKSFRCPGRYILLAELACSTIIAACVTDLFERSFSEEAPLSLRSLKPLFLPLAISGVISLVVVASRLFPGAYTLYFSRITDSLKGVAMVLIVTLLVLAATRKQIWALYVIAAFHAMDMGYHWSLGYLPVPTATVAGFIQQIPDMPDPGEGRILTEDTDDRVFMKQGYPIANGYEGLFPERTVPLWPNFQGPYRREDDLPARRLAAVHWAHPKDAKGQVDLTKWEAVPNPLPRVRLVSQAAVSEDILLDLPKYDIDSVALVGEPLPLPLQKGPAGSAHITMDRPGHVEVTASAPTRQLLVLSESWHPGWQITDNGHSTPLIRTYGDYQGCVVEAGEHHIVFHFAPRSFQTGKWGTILGLILTLGLYLVIRYRPEKRPASQ